MDAFKFGGALFRQSIVVYRCGQFVVLFTAQKIEARTGGLAKRIRGGRQISCLLWYLRTEINKKKKKNKTKKQQNQKNKEKKKMTATTTTPTNKRQQVFFFFQK